MAIKNLSSLFEPQSVALITASREMAPAGAAVARNLLGAGFGRKLFAVSPKGVRYEGFTSYPDIPGLPEAPDLAILVAAKDRMAGLLDRLGRLGAKTVLLVNPDDAPPPPQQGLQASSAIREAAKPFDLRIVGPGSIGVMTPFASLNASLAGEQPLKGNLALVSQSGTVLSTVLDWATSRAIGFSHLIDMGEMVDVDFGDMLDYLANDINTRAILLYLETVTRPRKFMSAARLAARMKPVVVLKGDSHPDPACSAVLHGGRTAGLDGVYHAAFRRAGMIRARDVRELFSAAQSLAGAKALPGKRVAVLTNGRGMGVLARDALLDQGGCLADLSPASMRRLNAILPHLAPDNPVNLSHHASARLYAEVLHILFEDEGVDAVLLLHCSNAFRPCAELAAEMVETLKKKQPQIPVQSSARQLDRGCKFRRGPPPVHRELHRSQRYSPRGRYGLHADGALPPQSGIAHADPAQYPGRLLPRYGKGAADRRPGIG
jgi:acetyltransferase